jgi:hypothetical protein
MKNLMIAVLVLATVPASAQSFEGTIKWSMKMEITDPAMKAQMADAQQKMNDPAMQAKMKEMQEKMKDPKFKAMMESNPQMKAMTERMMGGCYMMSNMIPRGMTIKIKGENSLMTMDGGMMSGDFLHTKDKSVKLNREEKTYWVMPSGEGNATANQPQPTVTKTSETTKILGYSCTKYVVTISEQGQTVTTNMWTTNEIKDVDLKAMAKQRMGRGQSMFYSQVEGVPLRIESGTPQGQMIMEVTEFKRESLNAADFTIPADYKETQGMFGRN